MSLKINRELHTYEWEGKPLPSVTQLLPEQTFYCTPEQLENARQQGTDTHDLIKMYWDTMDTFNEPTLIALEKWLAENSALVGKFVLAEEIMLSKKHQYAGTPDAVFKNCIIDFKRSRPNLKYTALQMAGYHIMLTENKTIKPTKNWLVLYQGKKGFLSVNVYNEQAEDIFLSLVQKYHIDKSVDNYLRRS